MEIQQAIRNNAEDLQTFIREMNSWEKEMKRKEKSLLESSDFEEKQCIPPIRNKISKTEDEANMHNSPDQQKREQSLFEKERGNELVKQMKWTEAIFHYTEAINAYSQDATFYTNRALCFLKLKKWKEAETDCTTALQIDATYEKAYFRRALALKELDQLHGARDDLFEVLRLDPDNSSAQNEIAKLKKMLPEHEMIPKGKQPDKKELAYMKKDKGNEFVRSKDWKSAIECYSEACRLYPKDASFYLNRALCFLKTNEPQKTILDCCRVLEFDPDNVKAYYRRALAHTKLNNLYKAHEDLLTAFKIDPSNGDVEKMVNTLEKRLGVLQEDECQVEIKDQQILNSEPNTSKRITGERFTKLGGYFVKPEKKAAHLLSKKPLKKINITDKEENSESILENALSELNSIKPASESDLPSNSVPQDADKSKIEIILNSCSETKQTTVTNEFMIPKSAIQFESMWDKLNCKRDQFTFLKKIGGNNFPSIFKEALESDIFSDILEVLAKCCNEYNESAYEFLEGLSKVKRFKALLLFTDTDTKNNIKELIQLCGKRDEIDKDKVEELKSLYYC